MRMCFRHPISLVTALLVSGAGAWLSANPPALTATGASAITQRRVFQEPLVPVGAQSSEEENKALAITLDLYVAKADPQAVAPLIAFLESHPGSPWRASLLSSLGWVYRQEGLLGRAQKAWREAWDLSKSATGSQERAVADWSAANLADLLGRVGKREELAALLKETKSRPMQGTPGSLLLMSTQQLAAMEQDPAHMFRCGPEALGNMAVTLGFTDKNDRIESMLASPKGTNLAELQAWGKKLGLDLVGIQLDPGRSIPVPALLQWKAGHFATVTKQEGNRYLVRNFLAGEDKWISKYVLAEEAGSFALTTRKQVNGQGKKIVSASMLSHIWGTGSTSGWPDVGPNTDDPKCPPDKCPNGMATYSFYAAQISLLVEDVPIWYAPPVGPAVNFHIYYNQWDLKQPATFTYWNLGSKWTMDWLSYVMDDPANPGLTTMVYMRGGGIEAYKGYNASSGAFTPQYYHHDVLIRTSATSYERRLPDGSREEFTVPDGAVAPRKIFMTKIVDPAGNALTLGYDSQRRLTTVTDALGQVTSVSYGLTADPLKVTQVTDPFGRTATFQYNTLNQLSSITDMGGITSTFLYGPTTATPSVGTDFLNTLLTPYGQTTFAAGVNGVDRWLQATDPLGRTERAEYHNLTGSMPVTDPACPSGFLNNYLYYRNTFYWDKRAMASGVGDWANAKIYHFLHSAQQSGYTSPILESIKQPLENRIWYGYGQSASSTYTEGSGSLPLTTARILDDGTTQRTQVQSNILGKITKSIDAVGRITTYTYSTDGVDLLEIRNTTGSSNDLLAKYTYNTQHKPMTVTDAAGQVTTLTYNGAGQIQTITNPKGETTTFTYVPSNGGYLTQTTGAMANSTTSFTYDAFGRVHTVTGPDGNTVTTDYDNLDRPTKVTYMDGTSEAMAYDKLDMVGRKDRQGRWTTMSYNPLRQLTEVQDPAGKSTYFDWCNCGSLEQLTDPQGRITNWWRDLQGRVIGKQLNDGTKTNYSYDSVGRLIQRVDAKGQLTAYQYYLDNNLQQVSYPNAQKPTPTVSYSYDPNYNRLVTMADGFGTTSYTYYPISATPVLGSGRLATVTGPFPNSTITYSYDELGRVLDRSIDSTGETRTFDSLGRIASVSNPLGAFQYTYQGSTGHLDNILLPNSQKTVFSYFDATGDYRLKGISNQKGDASVISAFNYTYNPDGTIATWSQQADSQIPKVYTFSYDVANQLLGAMLNQDGATGELIHQYAYGYDLSGNRTTEQIDGNVTAADYNGTNQLTSQRTSAATATMVMKTTTGTPQKKTGGGMTKSTSALPTKKKPISISAPQNP